MSAAIPVTSTVPRLAPAVTRLPTQRGPVVECCEHHGWHTVHGERGTRHAAHGCESYGASNGACEAVYARVQTRDRYHRRVRPALEAVSEHADPQADGYLGDVASLSIVLTLPDAAVSWAAQDAARVVQLRRAARRIVRRALGDAHLPVLDVVHPAGDRRPEKLRLHWHMLVPLVSTDADDRSTRIDVGDVDALQARIAEAWIAYVARVTGGLRPDADGQHVRRIDGQGARFWIRRELRPFPGWEGLPREVRSVRCTGRWPALVDQREQERRESLDEDREAATWRTVPELTDEEQDALLSRYDEQIRRVAERRAKLEGSRSAHSVSSRAPAPESTPEPAEGTPAWRDRYSIITPREACYIRHRDLRAREPGHALYGCADCAHVDAIASADALGRVSHARAVRWRLWLAYCRGEGEGPAYDFGAEGEIQPATYEMEAA